jgi:hypothetical protein
VWPLPRFFITQDSLMIQFVKIFFSLISGISQKICRLANLIRKALVLDPPSHAQHDLDMSWAIAKEEGKMSGRMLECPCCFDEVPFEKLCQSPRGHIFTGIAWAGDWDSLRGGPFVCPVLELWIGSRLRCCFARAGPSPIAADAAAADPDRDPERHYEHRDRSSREMSRV